MNKPFKRGLYFFQRDLRLWDQRGLSQAFQLCEELVLIVIFDMKRSKLALDPTSPNFNLITRLKAIEALKSNLKRCVIPADFDCDCFLGDTVEIVKAIIEDPLSEIDVVIANAVMEPQYLMGYQVLKSHLAERFLLYRDHEVVNETYLLSQNRSPYKVFTPFYKKWRQLLDPSLYSEYPVSKASFNAVKKLKAEVLQKNALREALIAYEMVLTKLDISPKDCEAFSEDTAQSIWKTFIASKIEIYATHRDFPAIQGTSQMSSYINNGTIGYRQLVRETLKLQSDTYLRQLAWRHFYMLILYHFPYVENQSFIESFKALPWENDPSKIEAWKAGRTGFDIIDAAMKELALTGEMHNRLRMICASFLVKHLDVNWQIGEAYFYMMLNDGDLALNNGGWQWCASTGNDAQPYFRIFNPTKQAITYDPRGDYRRSILTDDYWSCKPSPIIDLKTEGQKSLLKYKLAKKGTITDEDDRRY